jgi:hypothetical protein
MQSLRGFGVDYTARTDNSTELNSPTWRQFEVTYKKEKGPIVVECNRDEGIDSLARAECEEFIDEVRELEESPARTRVIEHLRKARFVVCCQLLSDIDEAGFEANGQLLDYFVDTCGGMIQADGEGFYDRMDLAHLLLALK